MASQYDLGTAHGTIEISASSLGRAISSMSVLGKWMLGIGALAVGGFALAVKSAAGFEQQLSRFKAVSDSTNKDIEAIRQKALQLGRDSAFGASEVAAGFVEIAKSGLGAKEILEGVGDAAVYLAAAGELDMTRSTEILVNALRTFKLEAKDATHIADVLAGAANASTSEIDDIAYSLRYAGPVAQLFGVSIEDTAAALAVFANVGIKGSTAGTTLRGILLGLAATTPKANKTLRRLGIITLDGKNALYDMNGALKPLPQVFQILQDSMKNMTPHEKVVALNAIFLRRAISGAAEAMFQGEKGFAAMRKEMGQTTAQEVMNEKLNNLKGSLKILKASIDVLLITLGSFFTPILKKVADGIRVFVNWLTELPPWLQKGVAMAIFFGGAIFLLAGAFAFFIKTLFSAYRAFRDLQKAIRIAKALFSEFFISLVTNPIFLVVAVILALIAATYLLYKNWDKVWNWIKEHKAYAIIIAAILAIFAPILLLPVILAYVLKNWKRIWTWIQNAATNAKNWIVNAFNNVIAFFKALPGKIWTALQALPGILLNLALAALQAMVQGLWAAVNGVIDFFIQLPFMILSLLLNLVVLLFQLGWMALTGLVNGLISAAPAVIGFLASLPGLMVNAVISVVTLMLQIGVQILQAIWGGIQSVVGWFVGVLQNIPGWIVGGISYVVDLIYNVGVNIIKGLWNGIEFAAGWLKDKISGLVSSIVGFFTDPLDVTSPSRVMAYIGDMMMRGLSAGLDDNLWRVANSIAAVQNAMTLVPGQLTPNGYAASMTVARGAGVEGGTVADAAVAAPASEGDGGFTYNNYAREVKPKEIVDEYSWQKMTKIARRVPV